MPSVPQNVLTYQPRRGSRPILPNLALGIAIGALFLTAVTVYIVMTARISNTGTEFGGALLFGLGLLALSAALELAAIILSFLALRWHFHHPRARIACILSGATLLVYVLCFLARGLTH